MLIPLNLKSKLTDDPRWLFCLRLPVYGYSLGGEVIRKTLALTAWESEKQPSLHHTQIDIRARLITFTKWSFGSHSAEKKTVQTIFRKGETYYGINQFHSLDGKAAKRSAIELILHDPLTKQQKAFVAEYGDELTMLAMDRYGEG